jgi:DNA-directed RNA polymerase subunit beta'
LTLRKDLVVVEDDCGTSRGFVQKALIEGGEVIEPLSERILGRVVAEDLIDPENGALLASAGTLLDEKLVHQIENSGVDEVKVRTGSYV